MQYEIIFAGFGGQGILSAGRLIAHAGMLEGKNVSWLPSYGPEMRGGTANCHIIVSDGQVGSPIIEKADILIAMNLPSFVKFEKNVKKNGLIIADSDMMNMEEVRTEKKAFGVNASETADKFGNKAFATLILIGKMIKETGMIKPESIEQALYKVLPENKHKMIPDEMKALNFGMGV
jgi:2-oxoglutarate ferredoxin oxidoreductase subunit gamma